MEEVITTNIDADTEREACMAVAQRALHKYAKEPDRMTFQRKFGAFLQRRGFSYETIKPILAELWQAAQGESLED